MSRLEQLDRLRSATPLVLPSLLSCDFADMAGEVARLREAGVLGLHLDVMDGVFVPNLTFGMPIVKALRRRTDLVLDVHLMITAPERYVEQFVEAGADMVTIHVEAVEDPRPVLTRIRECGAAAGAALNPGTPLARVEGCLDLCDLVLVMSVEAGFGGQEFQPVALDKLRRLRERTRGAPLLEVDGGVNRSTIAGCAEAGAQLLVVGSAIFRSDSYGEMVRELTDLAIP